MKKTIMFFLCSVCAAGIAHAEELVVQLKSGNSLTIQYSGSIQGVTWNGATDGIAGLTMPPSANAVPKAAQQAASAAPTPAGEKKSEGSSSTIRFRWAEPTRED